MREITLEQLLEAGCHFGHQVTRSNPKAREFIFEARDNIHIIDLTITKEWLEEAAQFVLATSKIPGSTMVIVGTKRQAKPVVIAEAKRGNDEIKKEDEKGSLMYVGDHWIGGLLTNFSEVSKNLKKLKDIEELLVGKEKEKYTKKELVLFDKERQKLERLYGGVKDMKKLPDALFIVDSRMEDLAVREARRSSIKTVAMVDTNSDPALVDFPIPANDDAVGSIELIVKYIIDTWVEGKNTAKPKEEAPVEKPVKESKVKTEKVKEEKAPKKAKAKASEKPAKKSKAKTK